VSNIPLALVPCRQRLPRHGRHRHAYRFLRGHHQGHPRLRCPRHLHGRRRAVREGWHRHHSALTGPPGLLVHLRL